MVLSLTESRSGDILRSGDVYLSDSEIDVILESHKLQLYKGKVTRRSHLYHVSLEGYYDDVTGPTYVIPHLRKMWSQQSSGEFIRKTVL